MGFIKTTLAVTCGILLASLIVGLGVIVGLSNAFDDAGADHSVGTEYAP